MPRAEDGGEGPAPGLVHGLAGDQVAPDWPPITGAEAARVLALYPSLGPGASVLWTSPRPMSAAALVESGGRTVLVKRHDRRIRPPADLAVEHDLAAHLTARGIPVPHVLRTEEGAGVVVSGDDVYEVQEQAPGLDLYRDTESWAPFRSVGHARAAGATLASLHLAAGGFGRAGRPFAPLMYSAEIVTSPDPALAVRRLADRRPGLASYLHGRPWLMDMERDLAAPLARARQALAGLPAEWGHGDWHPSNLTWTSAQPGAEVAGVFDLGLANRTFAVHDLAMALERSTVAWLDLAAGRRAEADLAAAGALLSGYQSVRPLSPAERGALPAVLPVVHVEFALSEVEYFHAVTASAANADLAYEGYLLGHARWFAGPDGRGMLEAMIRGLGPRQTSED